jgi:hypothetical protein
MPIVGGSNTEAVSEADFSEASGICWHLGLCFILLCLLSNFTLSGSPRAPLPRDEFIMKISAILIRCQLKLNLDLNLQSQ